MVAVSLLLSRRRDARFRSSPDRRPRFADRTGHRGRRAPGSSVRPASRAVAPLAPRPPPACARPRSSDHPGGQAQDKGGSAQIQPFAPGLRPPQICHPGGCSPAELDDWITAKSGSRHIPSPASARAVLNHEPLGGATAGLELRPDAGVAGRQQRRGGRFRPNRGRAARSATVLPQRSVPPASRISSVSRPSTRPLRKSRAALAISGAPRSELGASSPPSRTILPSREPDIEALVDADRLNAPARPAASGEAGGGESHGRERRASGTEPARASERSAESGAGNENSC